MKIVLLNRKKILIFFINFCTNRKFHLNKNTLLNKIYIFTQKANMLLYILKKKVVFWTSPRKIIY